jgi:ArsR family transcriptional regulator
MESYLQAVKALSDETRLRILNLILDRECCGCEVMQTLDISQTRASRNLRILENAGFLESRRDGVWIYYRLTDKPGNPFIKSATEFTKTSLIFTNDRAQLSKSPRSNDVCSPKKNPRKQGK